jgi:plastocyanin
VYVQTLLIFSKKSANILKVVVGGSAGLVYTPNSIKAAVGDMVIFTFMNANHTVTQSAFTAPCVKLPEGMDSGFMPNANNTVSPAPQMAMQVTVATPICKYSLLDIEYRANNLRVLLPSNDSLRKGNDFLHQPNR